MLENKGDKTSELRRPLNMGRYQPPRQYSGLQVPADEAQHPFIPHLPGHPGHKQVVVDPVEELLQRRPPATYSLAWAAACHPLRPGRNPWLDSEKSGSNRVSALPGASFRFHLAMDTLAVRLSVPPAGPVKDFHLQVGALCRAHEKERPSCFAGPLCQWLVSYYVADKRSFLLGADPGVRP
jgi:hypothetical protein